MHDVHKVLVLLGFLAHVQGGVLISLRCARINMHMYRRELLSIQREQLWSIPRRQ